eukprot:TRINITY_DN4878_c0_g1_i1.p1 TRINITY_DN4878_c0_g1~~TRINITY_DN4878_c0_g1_i1.p1  ORF type:complete len:484 (+),score=125.73 TRINITY_DN4878_c0_g1_i1:126-1454(+)
MEEEEDDAGEDDGEVEVEGEGDGEGEGEEEEDPEGEGEGEEDEPEDAGTAGMQDGAAEAAGDQPDGEEDEEDAQNVQPGEESDADADADDADPAADQGDREPGTRGAKRKRSILDSDAGPAGDAAQPDGAGAQAREPDGPAGAQEQRRTLRRKASGFGDRAHFADPLLPDAIEEERRRQEALDTLAALEKEFAEVKEALFSGKHQSIVAEIAMLADDSHKDLLETVERLNEIRRLKVAAADKWRQVQIDLINRAHAVELKQYDAEFDTERQQVKDRMIQIMLEKQKKVEDERGTFHLTDDFNDSRALRVKLRRRQIENGATQHTTIRKRIAPAGIAVGLKENEIMDDWALIHKSPLIQPEEPNRGSGNVSWDVDRSRLILPTCTLEKGDSAFIEQAGVSGRMRAMLLNLTPSEAVFRQQDGSKVKLPLAAIKAGRYSIFASL